MIIRFCVKVMVFLLVLCLCLPVISKELEPLESSLGVDLSLGHIIKDPGGAIQEVMDKVMNPLESFDMGSFQ